MSECYLMLFDGAVGPADPVVSAVGSVCGFCISSVRGVLRVLYVLVVCCVADPAVGGGVSCGFASCMWGECCSWYL